LLHQVGISHYFIAVFSKANNLLGPFDLEIKALGFFEVFVRRQNISEYWNFQQVNWEKSEARNTSPFQSDDGYNFPQKVSSCLTNSDDLRSRNKQPKTKRFLNLHDRSQYEDINLLAIPVMSF